MREIKFRAKVKGDAGLWNVWKIDWLNQQVELDGARGGVWTPMEKIQGLMQFTGLLDKAGKEIYEGDILATSNDGKDGFDVWEEEILVEPVSWSDEHSCFLGVPDADEESRYSQRYLYVKGNIYEHPNLLKS